MSDERKRPIWPWIVALLIGLPMLYVASFGPACWLADRDVVDFTSVLRAYPLLYRSIWQKDENFWSQGLSCYAKSGMSSRTDLEIEMKLHRAQLALIEERLANR